MCQQVANSQAEEPRISEDGQYTHSSLRDEKNVDKNPAHRYVCGASELAGICKTHRNLFPLFPHS
jgi:hypothetical protein